MSGPNGVRQGSGVRTGSVTGWRTGGGTNRHRGNGAWRGVLFLAILLVALGVGGWVVAGPSLRRAAIDLAQDNPQVLRVPFLADVVAAELAGRLDQPGGTDPEPVKFVIQTGQSVAEIAMSLERAGLLRDRLAFQYLVMTEDVDSYIQAGTFTMSQTMSPRDLVARLKGPPDPPVRQITLSLREGLRIEQIAALLEKLDLEMEVKDFYRLATDPPADVLAGYEFLKTLPKGRSLEGYFGSGNFPITVDISPEQVIRLLLEEWEKDLGGRVAEARKKGRDFYEALTLASLVERETGVDAERARIAGVYVNRLDSSLNPLGVLAADPTVIYGVDTEKLRKRDLSTWDQFSFWQPVKQSLARVELPADLRSYQTYQNPGLPRGPIATPSDDSLAAALSPDVRRKELFFYACPGSQTHVFARTYGQHQRNIASCKKR